MQNFASLFGATYANKHCPHSLDVWAVSAVIMPFQASEESVDMMEAMTCT